MAEAKKAAPAKAAKAAPAAGAAKDDNAKGPKNTPANPKTRGRRKTRIGYVVSDKMEKTIVVELEDRMRHALYGKIIRTTRRARRTTRRAPPGSATAARSWRRGRCRRPSAGGSSRSWRKPSNPLANRQKPPHVRRAGG